MNQLYLEWLACEDRSFSKRALTCGADIEPCLSSLVHHAPSNVAIDFQRLPHLNPFDSAGAFNNLTSSLAALQVVGTMREIVTLQFGEQSNYLGTHFWNTQVSALPPSCTTHIMTFFCSTISDLDCSNACLALTYDVGRPRTLGLVIVLSFVYRIPSPFRKIFIIIISPPQPLFSPFLY
jgi:hypothetical protein